MRRDAPALAQGRRVEGRKRSHPPAADRKMTLCTASAHPHVPHRGEGQIRYEAFRTVHADGIALREEFQRLPTTPPAMHLAN